MLTDVGAYSVVNLPSTVHLVHITIHQESLTSGSRLTQGLAKHLRKRCFSGCLWALREEICKPTRNPAEKGKVPVRAYRGEGQERQSCLRDSCL